MRFGPLAMKSTLALSNLGIDTNVFNVPDAEGPERDFTVTFTPLTDLWLRLGPTRLSGTIRVDWVYYNRFASERSANASYRVGWLVPRSRVTVRTNASRVSTRERPGFEIDARSQRHEVLFDGDADVRVGGKTFVGAKAYRRNFEFDRAAVFEGVSLARELNRSTTGTAFLTRHVLTPLTSVALEIGRERERFEFSPLRDSNSTRVAASVILQPAALIRGTATFGYRHFTPVRPDVPSYRGTTAALGLAYTLLGATRLAVQAIRDVNYSFDPDQPYYLETGLSGSVQRQVYGPFDVTAGIGTRRLAYRDRIGAVVAVPGRIDRVRTLSMGAGYRLGTDKRLGFTIDRLARTSGLDGREYTGLRVGTSLTYGT